ncbi:MAG: hypothetical protein PHS54_00235 [Clostridia bacterium]|nr:hypothetical protein [Clostridia bacterium]
MNIFDQLKDIIVDKQNRLSENIDDEKEFIPFMMQRWLSFYSPQFAQIVNYSTNMLWKAIDEKGVWYKLFTGIIPRSRFKNIKYIKKNKEEKTKIKIDKEVVTYLAERFELSRKEIQAYLESGTVDIKLLKKQLQND